MAGIRAWYIWDTVGQKTATAQYQTLFCRCRMHALHKRTSCPQPPRQQRMGRQRCRLDPLLPPSTPGLYQRLLPSSSSLSSQRQVTQVPNPSSLSSTFFIFVLIFFHWAAAAGRWLPLLFECLICCCLLPMLCCSLNPCAAAARLTLNACATVEWLLLGCLLLGSMASGSANAGSQSSVGEWRAAWSWCRRSLVSSSSVFPDWGSISH